MSRALDPKIKEALNRGEHAHIYQCVADVLSTREQELLDIEVLGPSHVLPAETYVLREGNAIAIPKFNILRAFLPAYQIFKEHLGGEHVAAEELLRATSVILLLDPEHMTAANARKRYIKRTKEQNSDKFDSIVKKELYFIDSLLTSRLHRHTKSPTLWGHRQWLLELGRLSQQQPTVDDDRLATALKELIFVSAERHPRNYYAWCHARYLLGLGGRTSQGRGDSSHGDEQGQQQQQQQQQRDTAALDIITERVKKWCFSHHHDTSGWSFLMVLIEQHQQEARAAVASALFSETLHLAEAYSWRGESVWYFLRTMLGRNWLQESHRQEFERVLRVVHGKAAEPEAALDAQILSHTLEWTKRHV
ncbi:hypothetical protein PWT90_04984 [Aphanocladium album]|nr:hypothetical protein PWT90_04984 [Aphanocladium album]